MTGDLNLNYKKRKYEFILTLNIILEKSVSQSTYFTEF
jgi:hypothetical protein